MTPTFHVERLDGRPPDFVVDLTSDDGRHTRADVRLVHKELAGGDTLVLLGDTEDGRRVSVRVRCAVLEDVAAAEVEEPRRARLTIAL